MKRLVLNPREERRLLRGHGWGYRNEFAEIPDCEDGEVVDVYSSDRHFVARGFFQANGGIAVRVMARHQAVIDEVFIQERVAAARAFRERLFPGETVYRWVFGESDDLPGLVADRYGAVVVIQTSCAFYRRMAGELAKAFLSHVDIEGVRLEFGQEIVCEGAVPDPVEVTVEGVRTSVSFQAGQKTGLFLDQRANWPEVRRFAQGARVLDGHCYCGMWSVHAALGGAVDVLGVDTSQPALHAAQVVAEANGVAGRCRFERADIAEVLARKERFDIVVLDPPALAKSRSQEQRALGMYQALNKAAMHAVEPGGLLITSSCSHFIARDSFLEMLKRASCAAQRTVWLLDIRGASPDHPVLMAMPETAYLKCAILRVL